MDTKVTLQGPTAVLVPMEIDQLDDLWTVGQNQAIWEFTFSTIRCKEDMERAIEAAVVGREQGLQIPFSVINKKTGEIVGSSRYLHISTVHKSLEIGWTWYHPDYWRTSMNTETKFLMLQHAFEVLDMNRVQFCTDSRNIRSQKAIARLGAQKEGVLRKHRMLDNGFIRDTVVFSILKEEWPLIRDLLQEKMERY